MSNALVPSRQGVIDFYTEIAKPDSQLLPYINQRATSVSVMCKCSTEAAVVVQEFCIQQGISVPEFLAYYDVIKDKICMKASGMLAKFREYGGLHEIIESSPDRAAIKLCDDGVEFTHELTWEQAQTARWPWKNPNTKEELKDNWSTPMDRANMLWARCISTAIRRFSPHIVTGFYTPEEIRDIDGEVVSSTVTAIEQPPTEAPPVKELPVEVIQAEFEVVKDEPATDDPNAITESQKAAIKSLYDELGVSQESRENALKKRGVNSLNSLNKEEAGEMIAKLEAHKTAAGN